MTRRKIWFDTEFIERGYGYPIDLISIGMIDEKGIPFYAENGECNLGNANSWVRENVIPKLSGPTGSRSEIAAEILRYIGSDMPEFWAYFADYDWVVLCQLFGTMMELPSGWPMWCRDLRQLCEMVNEPKLPPQEVEHHALEDARWTKQAWDFVKDNYSCVPYKRM